MIEDVMLIFTKPPKFQGYQQFPLDFFFQVIVANISRLDMVRISFRVGAKAFWRYGPHLVHFCVGCVNHEVIRYPNLPTHFGEFKSFGNLTNYTSQN